MWSFCCIVLALIAAAVTPVSPQFSDLHPGSAWNPYLQELSHIPTGPPRHQAQASPPGQPQPEVPLPPRTAPHPGAATPGESAQEHVRRLRERFPTRTPVDALVRISDPGVRERAAALLHLREAVRAAPRDRTPLHELALADPRLAADRHLIERYRLGRGGMYRLARLEAPMERAAWAARARMERAAGWSAGGAAVGAAAGVAGSVAGLHFSGKRDAKCAGDLLGHPRECSWGKWRPKYQAALHARPTPTARPVLIPTL